MLVSCDPGTRDGRFRTGFSIPGFGIEAPRKLEKSPSVALSVAAVGAAPAVKLLI